MVMKRSALEALSHANRIARTSLLLANPFATAWDAAKVKRVARMHLRDGTLIENVAGNYSLIDLVYEIFVKQVYCQQVTIQAHDIVVDIGANVGVFALYAARKTSGAIFAVEPAPQLAAGLARNLELNAMKNARVWRGALGGGAGTLALADWDATAPIQSLPRFMDENQLDQIDFLKMDCEGAEGVVLQTTPLTYLKRVRKIALEFHDNASSLGHAELARLLQAAGFAVWLRAKPGVPFGYLYAARRAAP